MALYLCHLIFFSFWLYKAIVHDSHCKGALRAKMLFFVRKGFFLVLFTDATSWKKLHSISYGHIAANFWILEW